MKFFLSVGFYHWEMNTDINNIDLTNGQAHEVIMKRDEEDVKLVHLQVSTNAVKTLDSWKNMSFYFIHEYA